MKDSNVWTEPKLAVYGKVEDITAVCQPGDSKDGGQNDGLPGSVSSSVLSPCPS